MRSDEKKIHSIEAAFCSQQTEEKIQEQHEKNVATTARNSWQKANENEKEKNEQNSHNALRRLCLQGTKDEPKTEDKGSCHAQGKP